MRRIHLTDQVYTQAERRAAEAGFARVDEYVADVLGHDIFADTDSVDHLFTSERLARIDQATAQIKAGEIHSAAEVREHFRKRFEA